MTKPGETSVVGACRFDPASGVVSDAAGRTTQLRPQTAQVFGLLIARRGELFTKDQLMHEVWADTHVTDDSLVQCISEIRKALGTADGKLLATVPKQGYRLDTGAGEKPGGRRPPFARLPSRILGLVLLAVTVLGIVAWMAANPVARAKPAIAVLPFTNMSGDPGQDYFSAGLAEDLLTDLSKIGELTVFSRSSTFGYADAPGIYRQVRDDLGASYVIEGSVQRDGERLRIRVQLIETDNGANLWAERYDRRLGDVFSIQDEVRANVVEALTLRLAPGELERMRTARPAKVSAYDLFLKGRYQEAALTRQGVAQAIVYYRQAIDADPTYGDAYARLGNMYDFSARYGWGDDPARARVLAPEMARMAVRLDPANPFAHWTLGRILSRLGKGPDSLTHAVAELQKAIAISPNYADAYAFISLLYAGSGDTQAARAAIATAFRLNPRPASWYWLNRGIVSYSEGDFAAAISDLRIATDKNPTELFTRLWLAASYARAGQADDAEWAVAEASALEGPSTVSAVLAANPVIQYPAFMRSYAQGLKEAGLPD